MAKIDELYKEAESLGIDTGSYQPENKDHVKSLTERVKSRKAEIAAVEGKKAKPAPSEYDGADESEKETTSENASEDGILSKGK